MICGLLKMIVSINGGPNMNANSYDGDPKKDPYFMENPFVPQKFWRQQLRRGA